MSETTRTARASISGPKPFLEQAKEYAADRGMTFSRLVRLSLEHTMEIDGVEPESGGFFEKREDLKDRNRFNYNKMKFLDRVDEAFTDAFKGRSRPKEIVDVARGYIEEAELIEEEARQRDDSTEYADGELVREVEHLVRETLEAHNLTNWDKRYSNRLERFDGVEDGLDRRRFALVLTQNAMRKDRDLEPFRGLADSERRVRADDLPELGDDHLPHDLDREEVADAARRLMDRGVDPDDLPTDPREFAERFGGATYGWGDVPDTPAALDGGEPDPNAGAMIHADGGDLDADGDGEDTHGDEQNDPDDQLSDEHGDDQDESGPGLCDLVAWAEKELRERSQVPDDTSLGADPLGGGRGKSREKKKQKARERAEQHVERQLSNTATWQHDVMKSESLTSEEVIAAADEYHQKLWNDPGEGDVSPAAVVGGEQV